jgi:ferredoxin
MKVKIDHDLCIGLGNCVAIAPGVFTLDKENKAVATNYQSADEKTLFEAAESCPVKAIIIEDDAGKQLYP